MTIINEWCQDEALSYIDDLTGEISDRSLAMNDVADQFFAFVEDTQSIEEIDAVNEAYFKNFKLIRNQQVKEAKEKALTELPDESEPEEPKQGVSTGAVKGRAVVAAGGMLQLVGLLLSRKPDHN